jgi:hypothetical protein
LHSNTVLFVLHHQMKRCWSYPCGRRLEWLAHLFQTLEWNSVPAIHRHSTLAQPGFNVDIVWHQPLPQTITSHHYIFHHLSI